MATVRFISWGVVPIGAFLAGALGSTLGIRGALWVTAGLILLAPAVTWTNAEIRRRRHLTDPRRDQNMATVEAA
jgi:hypothetical protein